MEDEHLLSDSAMAEYLTYLIAAIYPSIDKAETFECLMGALNDDITQEAAAYWGKQIKGTAQTVSKEVH